MWRFLGVTPLKTFNLISNYSPIFEVPTIKNVGPPPFSPKKLGRPCKERKNIPKINQKYNLSTQI